MKVCKVVLNSVSHDARVLKEAEALRELGHDVTIIGIQDANNRRPIDLLDNGVTIRRVAWTSQAVRPPAWLYAAIVAGIALGAAALLAAVFALVASWPAIHEAIRPLLAWQAPVVLLVALGACWLLLRVARRYRERDRVFRSTKKRENDELLKFQADMQRHLARLEVSRPESSPRLPVPPPSSPLPVERQTPSRRTMLVRMTPRPLMAGWRTALAPQWIARWKTVFARETMVRELLDEELPQVVHAHDVGALPVCAAYRRDNRGVKLAFDAHEVYDHLAQAEDDMAEINGKVMRKYQSQVDLFVTINESIASYYRTNYPHFPKAVIVKNATPRAPIVDYDGRLHEAARLPRERKILIYQGGYAPKRGLMQLLLSSEYLDPSWTLVFMGWGRLENDLRRSADALCLRLPELEERIRFVPRVPQRELPLWTAGATLGAIPYENVGLNHWFCTPNKLWEYPNAGVPIIASPFPELRRIIEPNEIGWFLPDPLSPREIGAAINALTPEALQLARARCLDFISRDNWSVYSGRLKGAYEAMA